MDSKRRKRSSCLDGGDGDDFLDGGAGDDFLDGGASGLDHLRGGEGTDQITYAASASGVEIYLDTQVTWDGVTMDFLSSIENVIGSDHADYIVGSEGQNVLSGGAGEDQFSGLGGDDVIDGGAGADVFMLRGLAADYTITAEGDGYRVTDAVTGRDGSDLLTGVETLRFSDGSTVALPTSAPAAPQVLPAIAGDKTTVGPEVFPAAPGDKAAYDGPQVLPGADDAFIFTDKFGEGPPVMPALGEFDANLSSLTELELARDLLMAMARDNPLNLRTSGDGLTVFEDWSGIASPTRPDVWE